MISGSYEFVESAAIALGLGVSIGMSTYIYYFLKKEDKLKENIIVEQERTRDEFYARMKRLEELSEKNRMLSEEMRLLLHAEVSSLRESISRSDLYMEPQSRKMPMKETRLKRRISLIQENAEVFLDIVNCYEEMRHLEGKEFVDVDGILLRISHRRHLSMGRLLDIFNEFRRAFANVVLIEKDRSGRTYVQIRES